MHGDFTTTLIEQEAYDWIKDLAIDISARAGKDKIDPAAWRVSAIKWMAKQKLITIRKPSNVPGKGTGYPAPSPQIRTSGFPASGSSVQNPFRSATKPASADPACSCAARAR